MSWSFLISEQAWRSRIEQYLTQPLTVYKEALTNNHYEGDVKGKATLNIVSIGELTYGDFTGVDADWTWQSITPSNQTLTIDQVKYTNFQVKDPDQTTTEINLLDQGSRKLAYQVSRMYDDYLSSLYTEIVTNLYGASGTTAWSIGGFSGNGPVTVGFNATAGQTLPTVFLSNMYQILANANADLSGPRAVVPPWLANYLLQELGIRWTPTGEEAIKKGSPTGLLPISGNISGFEQIYVSNLVPNTSGSAYRVMCGSPASSITFASALETVETTRIQNGFGTGVKALAVFGSKIPFEGHMGLGTVNQGDARTGIVIV